MNLNYRKIYNPTVWVLFPNRPSRLHQKKPSLSTWFFQFYSLVESDISLQFYKIVTNSCKGIKQVADLSVNKTIVNGIVRSQSGISKWKFKIDFNDYGKITGKHWICSDNQDSEIPKVIAQRIAEQIIILNKEK